MSSPAIEIFFKHGLKVYYVESPENRTLEVGRDWNVKTLPFTKTLDVKTFFGLYGRTVQIGATDKYQEKELQQQLSKLDWRVWPNVKLTLGDVLMAEYDAVGIHHYQCSFFECKSIAAGKENASDIVARDLLKLYQTNNQFGGPFGKAYWVLGGSYKINTVNEQRIRDFKITSIPGEKVKSLADDAEKYGLPRKKEP
jgi:hypothetical protein